MKLYLIRHGQSVNNVDHLIGGNNDFPLTELGMSQAKELDKRLDTIDAILSSNLSRARQTATILGNLRGITPTFHDELNEMDFGLFKGLTLAQAQEQYPDDFNAWLTDWSTFKAPGGESVPDVIKRLTDLYNRIVHSSSKDGTIAVVAHQMTIRCLLLIATGAGGLNCRIKNTGIITLDISDDGCYILF